MAVSILTILSTSTPSDRDLSKVIGQGNALVDKIESYHKRKGLYPASLKLIGNVPKTGLAKQRRFFYSTGQSLVDDKGPWFSGARAYLGKSPYVICVPLIPGGTLLYRPDGNYSDLPGHKMPSGWYRTSKD
jgi:hypothetical protein